MLRYKTETRLSLVALYDIRPGNGVGQFLQPRSPHGAIAPTHPWGSVSGELRVPAAELGLTASRACNNTPA